MEQKPTKTLHGITRVEGSVEGEALVTTEKLSHLFIVNSLKTDHISQPSHRI